MNRQIKYKIYNTDNARLTCKHVFMKWKGHTIYFLKRTYSYINK